MSSSLTADVIKAVSYHPGAHTVFITVGNTLRYDDGVGPYIAACLRRTSELTIIDAGQNPENVIDEVAALKPGRIMIIDAADFGLEAGCARLVDQEAIPETALSTHMISLKVIARLISQDTGVGVQFLGIQPESVEFKEGLSAAVKETADKIVAIIRKEFSHA